MTARADDKDREIIPRWRTFADTTTRTAELSSDEERTDVGLAQDFGLDQKTREWSELPTTTRAAELVAAALVAHDHAPAKQAASQLLSEARAPSPSLRAAKLILGGSYGSPGLQLLPGNDDPDPDMVRMRIRDVRSRLRRLERNPIAWTDLAREYVIIGRPELAERAMRTALSLAPTNRFVLRCATRFFVHSHEPGRAHHLIAGIAKASEDPWLMASEIATAAIAGNHPQSARRGRRMLERDTIAPRHATELASAVGTLELKAGRGRQARQLFELGRAEANDNSLAQLEWATSHGLNITLRPHELDLAFEARANQAEKVGDWDTAVNNARLWWLDEQFSSGPAITGSYVAAMGMRDFQLSKLFAERGLTANPTDRTLLNNLAFALLQLGDIASAAEVLMRIPFDELEAGEGLAVTATLGLLEYRIGNVELGRRLYRRAIARAGGSSRTSFRALAALMAAREEIRARTGSADELLREAYALAERASDSAEVRSWVDSLDPLSPDAASRTPTLDTPALRTVEGALMQRLEDD
jgi:Flp pilus assembly protein TadD